MKIDDSSLFFTCSLLELIGRTTRQKRNAVVNTLGKKVIGHIYASAGVLHCEPIAKTADYYIDFCHISAGDFDNVASCKYTVPTYWDIGKVYARLIEDVAGGDVIDTLFQVYNSVVCDMISNFNSDFFYQSRDYIKEYFIANGDSIEENCKKPAIRFSGFTDAWEQRRLGDISEKIIEKNAARLFSETFTNSAENGIISQQDYFDHAISNEANLDGYYVVREEDFVYNPRISVTAPVGPINRNKLRRTGVMSPLYTVFRPHDIDNTFLEYFFKSNYWHPYMEFNGDTGARSDRFSIKDSVFFEMPVPYPESKEQQKIGSYLTGLDRLITLHQRKYDKLSKIKKSMLEKLFPKNGSNVPEIRFAGFTDAWEQREFENFAQRKSEMGNSSSAPCVEYEDIIADQGRLNKDVFQKRSHKTGIKFSAGDVLFGKLRPYLKNWLLPDFSGVAVGDFWVLKPSGTDSRFLYYLIQTSEFFSVSNQSAGSKMPRADWNLVSQYAFHIPGEENEQQKIGSLFQRLDDLITLHQRELEKLKKIKQSCLEKMFV